MYFNRRISNTTKASASRVVSALGASWSLFTSYGGWMPLFAWFYINVNTEWGYQIVYISNRLSNFYIHISLLLKLFFHKCIFVEPGMYYLRQRLIYLCFCFCLAEWWWWGTPTLDDWSGTERVHNTGQLNMFLFLFFRFKLMKSILLGISAVFHSSAFAYTWICSFNS